jgi:hypothetical protein
MHFSLIKQIAVKERSNCGQVSESSAYQDICSPVSRRRSQSACFSLKLSGSCLVDCLLSANHKGVGNRLHFAERYKRCLHLPQFHQLMPPVFDGLDVLFVSGHSKRITKVRESLIV